MQHYVQYCMSAGGQVYFLLPLRQSALTTVSTNLSHPLQYQIPAESQQSVLFPHFETYMSVLLIKTLPLICCQSLRIMFDLSLRFLILHSGMSCVILLASILPLYNCKTTLGVSEGINNTFTAAELTLCRSLEFTQQHQHNEHKEHSDKRLTTIMFTCCQSTVTSEMFLACYAE